jgi:hypothetical protein
MRSITAVVFALALAGSALGGAIADFDDLALAPASYWNGSADPAAGGFTSGQARLNNNYFIDSFSGWAFWGGWSYSNQTDKTTPGYGNQYSAATGGAQSGANYGVAFMDTYAPTTPVITLPQARVLDKAYFTNTTYAYLDMLNGSQYSKKFGGDTGADPDWFLLTITGKTAAGAATGTVDFYLADFRFADNLKDYIVHDWRAADLSGLGAVKSLEFTLTSSDSSQWGMNTPAYFAMDTLTPEPASLALLAVGAAAVLRRRKAQKHAPTKVGG